MPKKIVHIGLLSDTHGHWDERMDHHLQGCHEIWHAGDIGRIDLIDHMNQLALTKTRIVFGNIDDSQIRSETSEMLQWSIDGISFLMQHIGGRPNRYAKGVRDQLGQLMPDVFICGHSHLLKITRDASFGGLYLNPGAAGFHGFHHKRTLLRFEVSDGTIHNMRVIELGNRLKNA